MQIGMVRAFWDESEYHRQYWRDQSITVLICQSKTLDITRLTLESLLNFYPDIPVLVVNNSPNDPSGDYLRYLSTRIPNLQVWDREGLNSHGESMDEAIRQYIGTEFVLTLDSDVIIERGGWIEMMLDQIQEENLFSTGTLMLVTRKNDACGAPFDQDDVLRYTHPSCSIYHVPTYLELKPFCNHGAPCCYTMKDAEQKGYKVGYFPIDKYVSHLSGSSWCVPRTIWPDDHNVRLRPFITFIIDRPEYLNYLKVQSDHDFDVIPFGNMVSDKVIMHDGQPEKEVNNKRYSIRFNALGDYVAYLVNPVGVEFVREARLKASSIPDEKEFSHNEIILYKRQWWQYKYVF